MPKHLTSYKRRRKWFSAETDLNITENLVYLSGYESGLSENRGGTATVTVNSGVFQEATEVKFGSSSIDIVSGELLFDAGDMPLAGDWTLEGWFYPQTLSSVVFRAIAGNYEPVNLGWVLWCTFQPTPKLQINMGDGTFLNSSTTVTTGAWHHFATTRKDNTIALWLDGAYEGNVAYASAPDATNRVAIGRNQETATRWDGYLDELRFIDGYAVYEGTSNITIPTGPY